MRDSAHYRFHYFKNSLAEKEIEGIIETQESAFQQILAFLELPLPEKKIFYYLYPDSAIKEQLMGSSWFAQSIYDDFAIHALYTEKDRVIGPHEDTHLLSLPLGLSIGFLQEGLAEYLVGHDWYGNDFKTVVQEALVNEKFLIPHTLLVNHQTWLDTDETYARQYYALAALFTKYLVNKYGKEKYFKLYARFHRGVAKVEDNKRAYMETLGTSAEEVFSNFLATLN
ncbi:MAG: hypothetical protein ACYCPH_01365 [Minisyncoccota bacterium]